MTSEPVPAKPSVRAAGPVPLGDDVYRPAGHAGHAGSARPVRPANPASLAAAADTAVTSRRDAGRGSWLLASASQRMAAAALVSMALWGLTAWAMGWW